MIHLLRRRSDPVRSELDEIKRALRCLKSSPAQTRCAVGAGVCLADTDFMRQFGGRQSFRQISSGARERFYAKLSELELSLRSRELGIALGVGLYRIWLADVLAGRHDAAELLGQELTELSRKASCLRPPDGKELIRERLGFASPGNSVRCIPAPCAGW
jgi:hypothetical protein